MSVGFITHPLISTLAATTFVPAATTLLSPNEFSHPHAAEAPAAARAGTNPSAMHSFCQVRTTRHDACTKRRVLVLVARTRRHITAGGGGRAVNQKNKKAKKVFLRRELARGRRREAVGGGKPEALAPGDWHADLAAVVSANSARPPSASARTRTIASLAHYQGVTRTQRGQPGAARWRRCRGAGGTRTGSAMAHTRADGAAARGTGRAR